MPFDPDRLRETREALKMSRVLLAELAGTSPQYVSHLENGVKTNPASSLLESLAAVLQCEMADLMAPRPTPDEETTPMRDADQARRELRRGMFYTPPTLLRPETTMDPTATNATLNDLTAEYLAVAAACREAYAAKTAADAAHEAAHKRWMDAGSVYAEAAFRLTDGPKLERIVVTEAGALLCRLYFGPSAQYSVDHAPIAAVVHAATPVTQYDPVAGSAGSLDRAAALARAINHARGATDSSPTPPPA